MPQDRPRARRVTSVRPPLPIVASTPLPYTEIVVDVGTLSIYVLHSLSDHLVMQSHHVAQPFDGASHHDGVAPNTSRHDGGAPAASAPTSTLSSAPIGTPSSLGHIYVPHCCITCNNLCLGPL